MVVMSTRAFVIPALVIIAPSVVGCTGSAEIKFVSLHPSEIDPPGTKTPVVKADQAYWHVDDSGDVHISIRSKRDNWLLGAFGRNELLMSIVPGPLPNGSARNYSMNRNTLRMLWHTGLASQRFASYAGVMALYMDNDRRCHGSFRMWTINPGAGMPIWFVPQTPGPTLVFGNFDAVRDENACERIRTEAEAGGWNRWKKTPAGRTTSQPASAPAGRGESF